MSRKYVTAVVLGFLAIIGWNVFLIQRDQKMFDAYDQTTPHERYCRSLSQSHPDCNVE